MSKKSDTIGQYWPAKKASEYLGYSTTTLRKWAIEGRIPAMLSPGGKYRYDVATFVELAKAASTDKLSKEAKKLKQKQDKLAAASAKAKADKLAARKAKALSQKPEIKPDMMPGEVPLPL